MEPAQRLSIQELLIKPNLNIPGYQRPYKWDKHNIEDLLQDISVAIEESRKYPSDYKYRIGTILLHDNTKNNTKDIVDGQQRIISLTLINLVLDPKFESCILDIDFTDCETKQNIRDNYYFIKQWFTLKGEDERKAFLDAFKNVLEVIVIEVQEQPEAFQLFDSQNSRGKPLYPHDLLKAYHLREMTTNALEMEHAVKDWEDKNPKNIKDLFSDYLFAICNWSQGKKTRTFSDKYIDMFKGTDLNQSYTYSFRAFRSSPYFQINEPFLAGEDFFKYVQHYMQMLEDIKRLFLSNKDFEELVDIIDNPEKNSSGFKYCRILFFAALLCYYDRFHNMDRIAVTRLFLWAFMIRVDMQNLGFDTINLYAIGDGNAAYKNHFPMFSLIANARKHTEISNMTINCCRNQHDENNWKSLADALIRINGR